MTRWQTKKLGDIATIRRGGSPRPIQDYMIANDEEGFNWLKIGDVPKGNRYIFKTSGKIKPDGLKKTTLVKKGDFILSNSMSFGRPYIMMTDACIHDGWLTLQSIDQAIDKQFLYYLLSSEHMQNKFKNYSAGSGVQNLKKETVQDIDFKAPEKPEQERIVKVLEAWDECIDKLDLKIVLNERLMKGLLQQLLTGNRRLPGFNDEWRSIRLGDVSDIKTGKKDNQDKVYDGSYPFFVRSPFIEKINTYSYDGEAILVPGEGNVGKIFHYIHGKFDYHQRVYKISDFTANVSGRFVYYYFVKHFAKQAKQDSVKATVDSLRLPTFMGFEVVLPSRKEQDAIVTVLDTTNNEVKKLKEKRAAIVSQKKYLLKQLITGSLRITEKPTPKGIQL